MAEAGNEKGGGKGNRSLLIIIIVALLLIVGVGTGAYYFGVNKSEAAQKKFEPTTQNSANGSAKSGPVIGPMVDIPSFIVNILDKNGGVRYLKASITLETDNAKTAAELKKRMPQIKDAILLLIGNKTFEDIKDLQGKLQLRAELLGRINGILKTGKVDHIYFTDFVVQ